MKFEMVVGSYATTELERDRALIAFCRSRIAERVDDADKGERLLLAGVQRVLDEFAEKFEHPHRHEQRSGFFTGQMDTLGWALRCVAFSAFSEHPDFRMEFKP
ncbi:hypothetical protein [Streptomyces sp. NPDC058247]|uniref:hypothetical protein n=1 Tax=Streptomyces sp. NPDC058247 TaxID=3346401 RepID=UPI0036F0E05C